MFVDINFFKDFFGTEMGGGGGGGGGGFSLFSVK